MVTSGGNKVVTFTWDSTPEVKVGETLAITGGSAPSGTAILYRSATPDTCTVADDGGVTGVGVGTCSVRFRDGGDSSNPSTPWSAGLDVSVTQGDHPTPVADPYGNSAELGYGETLEFETEPVGYGAVTYSLADGSDQYCSLDSTSGAITGIEVGGNCVVQVAFEGDTHYGPLAQRTLQTLAVVPGPQSVTFSEPYGPEPILTVGGSVELLNPPTAMAGEEDGGAVSYRNKDTAQSVCVVAADGTVTAKALGECTVQAQAAAPTNANYAPSEWIDMITMAVEEGFLSELSWNPDDQNSPFRVGAEKKIGEVDVGTLSGVTVDYSIANAGDTGCTFKGTTGTDALTLTAEAWGLCELTVTARLSGYSDWTQNRYVRIRPGSISVTAGSFTQGDTLKVGAGSKTPSGLSNKSPTDGNFVWELVRGEKDCALVDSSTGEVRANAVSFAGGTPQCSLRVVGRKRNYDTYNSDVVKISLEEGDMGTVTVKYGRGLSDVLPVGVGYVDIASLTEANGLNVTMTGVSAQGEGICTVDSDPSSATYGRVSVVEGAALGAACPVTVTVSAVGYADSEGSVTLTVSGELDVSSIAPVLVYDESLQIGVATPLMPGATTLLPDDNGAADPIGGHDLGLSGGGLFGGQNHRRPHTGKRCQCGG